MYFILSPAIGAVKIGYSADPVGRLPDLQTGSAERLVLFGSIPGDRQTESKLHRAFAHLRLHGDWFRWSDTLRVFAEDVIAGRDAEAIDPDAPPSGPIPEPVAGTYPAFKAMMRPIEARIRNAVGWPSSITWGGEPIMSGAKGRKASYQVMPDLGYDLGSRPSARFWWWHVDANPQWFACPVRAGDAFIAAWRVWFDVIRDRQEAS